jgi:Holliday junction resolvasome RuvABC ATP-dependent DNA helicase subunit
VAVDPTALSPQHANDGSRAPWLSQANAAFAGRQAELQHLKAAFEAAANGQGALIMLVGEPGIGKTALCEQLVSFVDFARWTPTRRPLLSGGLRQRAVSAVRRGA